MKIRFPAIAARPSEAIARAILLVATAILPFASANAQITHEYVPGEIIVKLKGKSSTLASRAFVGTAVAEKGMSLKGTWNGLNMHQFSLKAGQSVEAAVAELQNDPDVLFAEPNYIVHMQSSGIEGTPISAAAVSEATASNYNAYAQTSAPIDLSAAWASASVGLTPTVVAVIDTGIDYNHAVFTGTGAIWNNSDELPNDGIDNDRNGYIDDVRGWNFVSNTNSPLDDDGHGSHVSGIVLGATQDIRANPLQPAKIRIMPLKFLDANGAGTTSDAVKAIYYAVNNGANVLNNSWGGGGFSNSLLTAIAFAYDRKVTFVAAAGNAANNNDASPTYPANYSVPNMISVAATTDLDSLASYSNFGAQTVHVGSPGSSIFSTYKNNTWTYASGTSMATPFVAGMAALMIREAPSMTGYQVKELIFNSSVPIASLSSKTTTRKRINIENSLLAAKGAVVATSQPGFDSSSVRSPASDVDSEQVPACGLVAKAIYDAKNGTGPSGPHRTFAFFGLLVILVAPIFLSVILRNRDPEGAARRRHTRYSIDSTVTMKIGDRELKGQVSSISMGGLQVNTEAWLEHGGIVTMSIRSPDGKDQIAVEGKVVWSEEKKRYGVAFENADSSVKSTIQRWTAGLLTN